jgi:hypothetical protein
VDTISKQDWLAEATKLFGEQTNDWKFKCPSCDRVQSYSSIKAEVESGNFKPKRYFADKDGMPDVTVYSECTSPNCNWVAYGLFCGPVTVIIDPEKPHDVNHKENCVMAFEFAV